MSKMWQAVCWLVWMAVLLSLGGCSLMQAKAPPIDSAVETAMYEAEGKCWEYQKGVDEKKFERMTPDQINLNEAIRGLAIATGKFVPPCKHTTNNDLQALAMTENTKRWKDTVDLGKSWGGSIVTGVLGWKGLDTLDDLFANAGDKINFGDGAQVNDSFNPSNYNIVGDGNQFSYTYKPSEINELAPEVAAAE